VDWHGPDDHGPSARATALLAVAATLLAHGLSVLGGFAWDDQHTVLANPALQSAAGLWRALAADDWGAYGLRVRGLYRPLATLSLALDHAIFGTRAWGYHLTSLALHAFTAFALVRTLAAAGARAVPAFLAGGLFAVHPLGSEVADWVSARPDGLSAALAVSALWAALRDRPLGAVGLACAAAFAKEPGVLALPAVVAMVALRGPRRSALLAGGLSAVALFAYLATRRLVAVPSGEAVASLLAPAGWLVTLGRLGEVATGWAGAFLYPLPLDVARRVPDLGPWRWPAAAVAVGGTASLLLAAWRRRAPLPAAVAALGPGSLLLLARWAPNLSERYLYLPSLAAALALGLLGTGLANRLTGLSPAVPRLGAAVAGLVLGAGALSSASRARDWGDPLALFGSATVADPANPEAWRLLGAERHRRGDRLGALLALERAIQLGGTSAGLYSNLCAVRRETGDLTAAQEACDHAVALDPADPRPRYNRALLLDARGRSADARQELRRLRVAFPGYRPAREALRALGDPEPAAGPTPAAPAEPARAAPAPAGP